MVPVDFLIVLRVVLCDFQVCNFCPCQLMTCELRSEGVGFLIVLHYLVMTCEAVVDFLKICSFYRHPGMGCVACSWRACSFYPHQLMTCAAVICSFYLRRWMTTDSLHICECLFGRMKRPCCIACIERFS